MNLMLTGKYRQGIAASRSVYSSVFADRFEYDLTFTLNSQKQ